jgi:hypothetical protein
MRAMPARLATIAMGTVASTVLTLLLATLGAGCGPGAPEVDKAALYTPESLASEFAYRFRQLDPEAKTAAVKYKRSKQGQKDAERLARVDQAKNKTSGGAPAKKKQAAGPRTLDDLLADIDSKIDLIKGVSRADACRKMAETISADASVPEDDKKRLTELVGKLGEQN